MPKPVTVGYMVGRFNPLQLGHLALLRHVAEDNDHMLVLVGSATESRTHKNPLTYEERKSLIVQSFPKAVVLPLPDMPSDEDWVKLFESTISLGIQGLALQDAAQARLYSADATRADDYALRCAWVQHLGHSVMPFKPVMARTDLSASLVRDNWYNGRYDDVKDLVPQGTFDLMQQLDIGWMRSAYVKKVALGALAPRNSAFVAFISEPDYLYRADPTASAGGPEVWDAKLATLGYVVRSNGELGFVGGRVDPAESLEQTVVREAFEEIGAKLDATRLELVCSHAMTGKGLAQHTHLYVYPVTLAEMYELRRNAVTTLHSRTELAGFAVTHLATETPDILLQQKWAGTALDELRALLWAGRLPAAQVIPSNPLAA